MTGAKHDEQEPNGPQGANRDRGEFKMDRIGELTGGMGLQDGIKSTCRFKVRLE